MKALFFSLNVKVGDCTFICSNVSNNDTEFPLLIAQRGKERGQKKSFGNLKRLELHYVSDKATHKKWKTLKKL